MGGDVPQGVLQRGAKVRLAWDPQGQWIVLKDVRDLEGDLVYVVQRACDDQRISVVRPDKILPPSAEEQLDDVRAALRKRIGELRSTASPFNGTLAAKSMLKTAEELEDILRLLKDA